MDQTKYCTVLRSFYDNRKMKYVRENTDVPTKPRLSIVTDNTDVKGDSL